MSDLIAQTSTPEDAEQRLATRRQSLLAISRFVAATAPAMLVLLHHGTATAATEKPVAESADSDSGINPHTGRHSNG